MRINVLLPDDILKKIDSIAKEVNNRSQLLREAAEKFIEEHERLKAERIRKEKLKQAIEIQNKLR